MAELVNRHYDAVYRFCARRIGVEMAKDATQETFILAQRSLRKFQGRSAFETWLIGIALNQCRNLARKSKREIAMADCWIDDLDSSPEDPAVDREMLRKALSKLSEEHREVVLLHEIEGYTYEEIATLTAIPVGTVKSRLFHAFQDLRRLLSGCAGGVK